MDRSIHSAVVMLAVKSFLLNFYHNCDNFLVSSVRFDHSNSKRFAWWKGRDSMINKASGLEGNRFNSCHGWRILPIICKRIQSQQLLDIPWQSPFNSTFRFPNLTGQSKPNTREGIKRFKKFIENFVKCKTLCGTIFACSCCMWHTSDSTCFVWIKPNKLACVETKWCPGHWDSSVVCRMKQL